MKKMIFALMVLFFSIPAAQGVILDGDGKPLPSVVDIFSLYKHRLLSSEILPRERIEAILEEGGAPTVEELNALAQDKFLRPAGAERLDGRAIAHYAALSSDLPKPMKETALLHFQRLGDLEAVFPQKGAYDWILLHGSTVQDMRGRIMFLATLIKDGQLVLNETTEIAFLTGERPLFSSETEAALLDPKPFPLRPGWRSPAALPHDEREAAKLVWDQLDFPLDLRAIPVRFIDAIKKPGATRAQTEDTVLAWVEASRPDKGGDCLIISSNPFVHYQQKVMELMLLKLGFKNRFVLEGVGPRAQADQYPLDMALGVLLDNLARTLYLETQLKTISRG